LHTVEIFRQKFVLLYYDIDELKKSIHEKIDHLDDKIFFEQIAELIDGKGNIFEIPEGHIAGIIQGEQDIKNGDYLTLDELQKRYEKWLKD
jgi:poly(3-hydroxyalkanoate) synthetase